MDAILRFFTSGIDTIVIVFFGLVLAVFALFSIERALYKLYLITLVRSRWFPNHRFALTCTNGDDRWENFLSERLLPEIEEFAVIFPAHEPGLAGDFERKLVNTFMERSGMEPAVVFFLPYFEVRVVSFGEALNTPGEAGERMLTKARNQVADIVEDQRDRMRLYI